MGVNPYSVIFMSLNSTDETVVGNRYVADTSCSSAKYIDYNQGYVILQACSLQTIYIINVSTNTFLEYTHSYTTIKVMKTPSGR